MQLLSQADITLTVSICVLLSSVSWFHCILSPLSPSLMWFPPLLLSSDPSPLSNCLHRLPRAVKPFFFANRNRFVRLVIELLR